MLSMMAACTSIPEGVQPVRNFDLHRYLGQWYEVARLDHAFERGLSRISAQYSMRQDGGVEVLNRGWSAKKKVWKKAVGKAYFVGKSDEGYLKVSFFGPFYGAYVIFSLDSDYQYAFVSGPNKNYLWLLARTPTVPVAVMQKFRQQAKHLGFDMRKLIMVKP